MYDARQIANWFVQRAEAGNTQLSIMQLLKLVYIAHGWHLEMRRRPLFLNRIEAWRHGPVIPDVYSEFRGQGIAVSKVSERFDASNMTAEDEAFLQEIYRIYGRFTPFQLSDMTHESGGPWDKATKMWGNFAPITNDIILEHYAGKRAAAEQKAHE
jgi:uncharacterized phage-associated protein